MSNIQIFTKEPVPRTLESSGSMWTQHPIGLRSMVTANGVHIFAQYFREGTQYLLEDVLIFPQDENLIFPLPESDQARTALHSALVGDKEIQIVLVVFRMIDERGDESLHEGEAFLAQ